MKEQRTMNMLKKMVREKDTDTFTKEEWKRIALAGSIYWV
jgi:hypothetical protein